MHQAGIIRGTQKLGIRCINFHKDGASGHQYEDKFFKGSKTKNIVEGNKYVGKNSLNLYFYTAF